MFQDMLNTYASFFDGQMWLDLLTDPVSWGLILTLVILEGLLSADNALVLATIVNKLPEKQRKKALLYGLWGAYLFRFIAIGVGTTLAKFAAIKLIGALYLYWITFKFFRERMNNNQSQEHVQEVKNSWLERQFGLFWATVASVELMDIAFSVDSILAAIALSDNVGILIIGGALGILMMRMVAGVFVKLIEKVPEMEVTAYVLIGIIASKMALSVFHIEISHMMFFTVLILAFIGTYIVHVRNKRKHTKE